MHSIESVYWSIHGSLREVEHVRDLSEAFPVLFNLYCIKILTLIFLISKIKSNQKKKWVQEFEFNFILNVRFTILFSGLKFSL